MVLDLWRPSELLPLLLGSSGTSPHRPSALCGDISTLRASIQSNTGVLLHSASPVRARLLLSWPTCVCTMWFGTYATCEKEEGNAAGPTLELSGPAALLLERSSHADVRRRKSSPWLNLNDTEVEAGDHFKCFNTWSSFTTLEAFPELFFDSRCYNNKNRMCCHNSTKVFFLVLMNLQHYCCKFISNNADELLLMNLQSEMFFFVCFF